ESYYQEAGRAGRDGRRAYALLLVAADDSDRIARRFEQEFPPLERVKEIYERVCSYLRVGIGEGGGSSYLFNLHDFCAREHLWSGTVAGALKLLQQNGYLTLTDAQDNPARILFCISRDELYKLRVRRDDLDHFIRTILRLYNGVFTEFRPIDEGELATWSGYTVERVRELLKTLWQLRVIRYIPSNRSPILFLNEERLPREDLYIAPETYLRRQQLMRERFERMVAYAANGERCRSAVLESYFGADDPAPCGVCDICLARKRAAKAARDADAGVSPAAAPDDEALAEELLRRLAASPADPHTLATETACDPGRLTRLLRELLERGKIAADKTGILKINE
ncbi:MAG: RecQ family zinc-binding domain-containing protein, partial [Alistipes dispar]